MVNCPDILAPSNEDLLSIVYEEGTLSVQEQAHFDQCPICQQRLAEYSKINTALLKHLYRLQCPDAMRLSTYCLGILPAEERTRIASHLLDCLACTDEVAKLRQWQRAFEPFPPGQGSSLRSIFATLVVQQAKLVLRNDTGPANWPRQYRADALDLSLHLSRQASGETMLLGILTSSDPTQSVETLEGLAVELYIAPGPLNMPNSDTVQPLLATQIDDLGNLLLEPVPAGEYILIIRLSDKEVVIEDLKIEQG